MNFYPHHIGDFRSATIHLSRLARSIYRDLIDIYYDTEQPLPDDEAHICWLVCAKTKQEKDAVTTVLRTFYVRTTGVLRNSRCDEEIAKYQAKRDQARAAVASRKDRKMP